MSEVQAQSKLAQELDNCDRLGRELTEDLKALQARLEPISSPPEVKTNPEGQEPPKKQVEQVSSIVEHIINIGNTMCRQRDVIKNIFDRIQI